MLSLLYLTALLLSAETVQAAKPLGKEVCVGSCYYSLLQARFTGSNPEAQKACTNTLRVSSMYSCIALHCNDDGSNVEAGLKWWARTCKNSSRLVNMEAYRTALGHAKLEQLASRPADPKELSGSVLVKEPVVPSSASWEVAYRSAKTFSDLRDYHNAVSWVPYGFWAIILLLGTASRVSAVCQPKMRPSQSSRTRSAVPASRGVANRLTRIWKFDLQLAPTFAYRHHEPWGWLTVPLRLQSMVIVSYIVIHIVVCAVHYPILEENYYYKTKKLQVLRCLGDRTAALLPKCLPLIFLFGARSNPFQVTTGWSFRTFSLFHRWIAIVMVVEATIHGVVLSAYDSYNKGWEFYKEELRNDEIFRYGILTAVAMGLSSALAARCFRAHFYEIFKAAHIILAAVALAALYEHIKDLFTGMYKLWVWICVGIWAGEYVVRFLRIIWLNIIRRKTADAIASFSQDTGVIRLSVACASGGRGQTPGQYYFISFCALRCWQSHPFSVAARSEGMTNTMHFKGTPEKVSAGNASPTITALDLESLSEKPNITFMIRPRNGMTGRLREMLSKNGDSAPQKIKVVLEGPYGTAANVEHYNHLLFIVGGSGITAVLPYLRMLQEKGLSHEERPTVQLVWSDPRQEFMRQVIEQDLGYLQGTCSADKLTLDLYVTSSAGDEKQSQKFPCRYARPDIDALVQQFVQQGAGEKAAVFVCGPGKMADNARAAVIRSGKSISGDVDLFEEMYEW
ncbi:hypothetical protein E4U17_000289 [Claviceps sp. LM77 group G4]|nr:hypothetical protein E4U17_000289 [Claviceps sp. LM77 group G4]KAG6076469.1 hypothetical protein E4U33_001811 [Claviceps sp. LM78 group G4]KAG6077757.1 hypothetical protein E4U16_002041 [Claviceps sp. LM84 group G4]